MSNSRKSGWLLLAGSAALVALMVSLPTHANAQTITICVQKGLIVGIDTSCSGSATAVTWTGPSGPTGAVGPTGATGAQGAVGPGGAAGMIGLMGVMGPSGPQGPQGEEGPANPISGAGGIIGPTGPTGAAGATGATGAVGPTGLTGAPGVNTEDVVVLTGGTLGLSLGTQAGIQVAPGEADTIGPGNGAQQQGHLQAETFVPVPNNPTNPTAGVLQDFHFAINPGPGGPGGTGGSYSFSIEDLTHPLPGGMTFVCSITQGFTSTPPVNGATASSCPDLSHGGSCTCEDDEQVNPAGHLEIVGVNPGDSIAVIVTTTDMTAPTNKVNVRFSMNYVHDDQI